MQCLSFEFSIEILLLFIKQIDFLPSFYPIEKPTDIFREKWKISFNITSKCKLLPVLLITLQLLLLNMNINIEEKMNSKHQDE